MKNCRLSSIRWKWTQMKGFRAWNITNFPVLDLRTWMFRQVFILRWARAEVGDANVFRHCPQWNRSTCQATSVVWQLGITGWWGKDDDEEEEDDDKGLSCSKIGAALPPKESLSIGLDEAANTICGLEPCLSGDDGNGDGGGRGDGDNCAGDPLSILLGVVSFSLFSSKPFMWKDVEFRDWLATIQIFNHELSANNQF